MTVRQWQEYARDLSDDMQQAGRQVWLAGLGAVGMAGNTSQAVFGMLVEEGQKIQKQEMKRFDRFVDQATDRMHEISKLVEGRVQATTKVALGRLGLPSRKDVSDLMARVDQLTLKVEGLKTRRRVAHAR
jgi:poly(hydroxyalkanoate) granule-associated protein